MFSCTKRVPGTRFVHDYDIDPRSVHAFIIGEHGDSEVPVWWLANIAGMRLQDFYHANGLGCTDQTLEEIFTKTRDATY